MTELLRKELGYDGVLFSDDLEMRAVLDLHPPAESAVLAVAAGCDSVLVCKEEEHSEAAFEGLLHELEKSAAFRTRVTEAAGRMRALRARAHSLFEARAKEAPSVAEVKLG
jgi:beta-N-acetylhexosaminidase